MNVGRSCDDESTDAAPLPSPPRFVAEEGREDAGWYLDCWESTDSGLWKPADIGLEEVEVDVEVGCGGFSPPVVVCVEGR